MLGQRVITALALLAVLVPALLAENMLPFQLLCLLMVAAAAWEWGRLNGASTALSWGFGLLVVAAAALSYAAGWVAHTPPALWWLASLIWVLGGALALRAGPTGWPLLPRAVRWALGLLALWVAWLALCAARGHGVGFILSVFCLVWVADIAAYFGGRALGRRKLAPSISPGKSWEGVWTGLLGVVLLGFFWIHGLPDIEAFKPVGPSLFSALLAGLGGSLSVLTILALGGLSVVGDLVESLVKRAAGAKDSSRLLPGHGGVLDRIDALLPVFPVAMALMSLLPGQP